MFDLLGAVFSEVQEVICTNDFSDVLYVPSVVLGLGYAKLAGAHDNRCWGFDCRKEKPCYRQKNCTGHKWDSNPGLYR